MASRYVYREHRLSCSSCGPTSRLLWNSQELPKCECGEQLVEQIDTGKVRGVIGDDIPGGVEITHGLGNQDGSPRRYYSHTEIRAEAARRGLKQIVEHKAIPGTDKSPHTVRWVATPDMRSPEQRKRDMAAFLGMTYERYIEQFG